MKLLPQLTQQHFFTYLSHHCVPMKYSSGFVFIYSPSTFYIYFVQSSALLLCQYYIQYSLPFGSSFTTCQPEIVMQDDILAVEWSSHVIITISFDPSMFYYSSTRDSYYDILEFIQILVLSQIAIDIQLTACVNNSMPFGSIP